MFAHERIVLSIITGKCFRVNLYFRIFQLFLNGRFLFFQKSQQKTTLFLYISLFCQISPPVHLSFTHGRLEFSVSACIFWWIQEAMHMNPQGTVVVRLYTSSAMIPIQGAVVSFTQAQPNGEQALLAVRVTNFDGLTEPVAIQTPPSANSTHYPGSPQPYAAISILAGRRGFDRASAEAVQVFPGVETVQALPLIPTPALPASYARTERFIIPPQTLSEV